MGDCIMWPGARDDQGYGRLRYKGIVRIAHRVLYELAKGDPGKNDVHHTCENPGCINPQHLELVPHNEHARKHLRAACSRGHEYTEGSYYLHKNKRMCIACKRERRKPAAKAAQREG